MRMRKIVGEKCLKEWQQSSLRNRRADFRKGMFVRMKEEHQGLISLGVYPPQGDISTQILTNLWAMDQYYAGWDWSKAGLARRERSKLAVFLTSISYQQETPQPTRHNGDL